MTQKYELPVDLFAGKTVAVLAPGPRMTQELADSFRNIPCIAARTAFRFAPWADMLVSIDGPPNAGFWDACAGFAGIRVCGTESEALDAMYLPIAHEVVTIAEGHVVHIRNNLLAAIRIAAAVGAAKILLVGVDTQAYDAVLAAGGVAAYLTPGLAALIAELAAQGIEVERVGGVEYVGLDLASKDE